MVIQQRLVLVKNGGERFRMVDDGSEWLIVVDFGII